MKLNVIWFVALAVFQLGTAIEAKENSEDTQVKKWFFNPPKGINNDVLVVLKNGQRIHEYYDRGYAAHTPHLSWSMAKTITGILIAQASEEYKFDLNEPVKNFLKEFKGEATINDLLQMSSGIHFTEDYFGIPVNSDVVRMLYLDGPRVGIKDYMLSLPIYSNLKAGEYFYYSSGDTNLLMAILKEVINDDQVYSDYPFEKFFKPLGIEKVTFEKDSKGVFIGSSYIYLSTDDYLKVGQLIVNQGKNEKGQQVIPTWYYKKMYEVAQGVKKNTLIPAMTAKAYSLQVTTNQPIEGRAEYKSEFQEMPKDTLFLLGHQGQMLAISSKEKMIVLRLGMDKIKQDMVQFTDLIGRDLKNQFSTYLTAREENEIARKQMVIKDLSDASSETRGHTEGVVSTDKNAVAVSEEQSVVNINKPAKFADIFKVPQLIRSFSAKEFCSCYFITGRGYDWCHKDVSYKMPIMPSITIDGSLVTTKLFFGSTAQARFINEREGCLLTSH